MPDGLTSEDRALIDAALERGAVTRVPTGASAEPEITWDGKQLVYADRDAATARRRRWGSQGRQPGSVMPWVARRRAELRAMVEAGRNANECAEALGIHSTTIYSDMNALGLSFPRPPALPKKPSRKRKARPSRDRAMPSLGTALSESIRAACDGTRSTGDIARHLSLGRATVGRYVKAMGLEPEPMSRAQKKRDRDMIARHAALPGLVASGMTNRQIAQKFGVSPSTVKDDMRALGITRDPQRMAA